jgi:chromosome segregation ATPase
LSTRRARDGRWPKARRNLKRKLRGSGSSGKGDGVSAAYSISDLNTDQLGLFVKAKTITPEMAQALQKIMDQKAVVAKLEEEVENRQKDIDRIVEDQGRLRENMKALRGSAEEKALLQRYTKQLDEQETQLESLRKTIPDTEASRDKANDQLEKMIDELQIEATL